MIYNTRYRSTDTTESLKEKKTRFNAHSFYPVKNHGTNKDVVIKKLSYVKVWE